MPVAIIFVSPRPGIIRREEPRRSVAVVHFPQESGARQDVVVRIERVAPEAVASAKRSPGFGHELHQAHRALGRDGTAIPTTLDAHDRPYPRLRDGEALGRFGNQTGVGIARRPHRDRRCLGVDGDGPEIGAGWKRTGEKAGEYVSLVIDDPALAQPIRANLFQSGEDKSAWVLNWNRPPKRGDRG